MDRYANIREDIHQILENTRLVLEALDRYEALPVPSIQMGLDLQISSLEIFLQSLANDLRKRLL